MKVYLHFNEDVKFHRERVFIDTELDLKQWNSYVETYTYVTNEEITAIEVEIRSREK